MEDYKLYMLLLGCTPAGRHTEQHDIFFTVGKCLKDTIPDIQQFWPGSGPMHLDAWREVTHTEGYRISVIPKDQEDQSGSGAQRLFFINLGGYKAGEFDEYHYRMLLVGKDKSEVIRKAKQTTFYKHTGFKGAESHIDDKYGVDVDDLYEITDILPLHIKEKFSLLITEDKELPEDTFHLGYTVLSKIK